MTTSAAGQVLAPESVGPALRAGKTRKFRKMLLPRRTVKKGDRTLAFDDKLFAELVRAEREGAFDSIPLQVADHHTDNPKFTEGRTSNLVVLEDGPEGSGLYGDVEFATDEAASMIDKNPKVGVSVRMVQNLQREEDGRRHEWKAAVKHVLLTTDPHVRGMGGWTPAADDLDRDTHGEVIDLQFDAEETTVTDTKTGQEGERVTLDLSREEFTGLTELLGDLKAAKELAGRGPGDGGTGGGSLTPGTVDLEREDGNTLDLMRAEIGAERQARIDLQRELIGSKADRELDTLLAAGLAPRIVDLARPLARLGLGGDSVIDLDRGDGSTEQVDAGKVLRDVLSAFVDLSRQGVAVIDLDAEQGMDYETDDERRESNAMAEAFDRQFPI